MPSRTQGISRIVAFAQIQPQNSRLREKLAHSPSNSPPRLFHELLSRHSLSKKRILTRSHFFSRNRIHHLLLAHLPTDGKDKAYIYKQQSQVPSAH
jgi:hypothetical protein